MGLIKQGQWVDEWYDTKSSDGKFQRSVACFRHWVTEDGSAGPTGMSGFAAESGRYKLYVSLACPWAHRTLIFRPLKDLDAHIDVEVVDPVMLDNGWELSESQHNVNYLYQLYLFAEPNYEGRVTVPVLWDNYRNTIVSNESSDIIRMFNSAFNQITGNHDDYYPVQLRDQIDRLNTRIYDTVNNGVYKTGFATSQRAYEDAFNELFESLSWLEHHLSAHRYLAGARLTEADWRLFTTLVRFDAVYFGHFKCNQRQIKDYPAISNYVRELYQYPGIAQTVNFDHIKRHYYVSHPFINPTQVVPLGPEQDFNQPHDRHRLSGIEPSNAP